MQVDRVLSICLIWVLVQGRHLSFWGLGASSHVILGRHLWCNQYDKDACLPYYCSLLILVILKDRQGLVLIPSILINNIAKAM